MNRERKMNGKKERIFKAKTNIRHSLFAFITVFVAAPLLKLPIDFLQELFL